MQQYFDGKVVRTFTRSRKQADFIIKQFGTKMYEILETPKTERGVKGATDPNKMTATELVEHIQKSENKELLNEFSTDPRKTVREASKARLIELMIPKNQY